ncbi:hypothetical protein [Lysobacter sp. HA35]
MKLKPFLSTLVACAIAALLMGQAHAGMFLFFVTPMVFIWAVVNAYLAWREPLSRRHRATRVAIWAVTLASLFATHTYYKHAARLAGQAAANAVTAYRQANGAYPPSLKAVGRPLDPQWRVGYVLGEKGPFLFYPSTFVPFDIYSYNFEHSTWEYQPD